MDEITNRQARCLLADLEERRATRASLKRQAEAKDEHLLAVMHSVAEDAYFDAFRMVAQAMPRIVEEASDLEEPPVGTPVMDLRLDDMAPGELVEAWGK